MITDLPNSPCRFCHQNLDTKYRPALDNLESLVIRFREGHRELWDEINKENGRLDWNVQLRCKYGLPCTRLRMQESNLSHAAENLNKTLIFIAKNDEGLYHEVLQLCRGYFPRAYRKLEMIHYKNVEK